MDEQQTSQFRINPCDIIFSLPNNEGGSMVPHVEENGREVPGTRHKTGETDTPGASYAHSIVLDNPDLVEVEDDSGVPCHPFSDE